MLAVMRASSLSVALLVIAHIASAAYGQVVPLSCSVVMYNSYDYTSDKCVNAVINARKNCGGIRIAFIPTLFWWQNNPGNAPKIQKFCTESGDKCEEVNPTSLKAFRDSMLRCFNKALELNFTTFEVVPHLDDAHYVHWRAKLNFSPEKQYGKYSYYEAVLLPLSDALNEILDKRVQIYFALVGEMSATVFRSANDWIPVVRKMKAVVGKSNKRALAKRNIHIGLSVNWNKLCGCYNLKEIDAVKYLKSFIKAFKTLERKRKYFNSAAVQKLYKRLDFVGVSYYPYKANKLTPTALETTGRLFAMELGLYGVNLTYLISKGKELRFQEFGLGGGIDGNTPATTLPDLMRYPFFGVGGVYNKSTDPWELWRPEGQLNKKRVLLRKFYSSTLRWLSKGGGPQFNVSAVYLWNSGSWDVTGVCPDSYSPDGSFRDPVISDQIKQYNDKGIVPM